VGLPARADGELASRLGRSRRADALKAAVCHEFGKPLVVEDVELDPPNAGEIAVRVAACGVCHSDIASVEGAWGGQLPAVFGHEAAGVVEEVGGEVDGIAVGDHVVVTLVRSCGRCPFCAEGQPALCEATFPLDERSPLHTRDGREIRQGIRVGGFAESVVAHASQAVAIPDDVPLASACLLGCAVVSGFGAVVNTAQAEAGSSVVVIGTGGVGLNCLQGAAVAGASPIVAVDVVASKLDVARAFGATHAVEASDASEAVRDLTGGRGADYVFVAVGARGAVEQGLSLLRRGGTLVLVGMPAAGVTAELDPTALAHDGQRILGSKLGSTRPEIDIPMLVELYREGRLKLDELVSGRSPLEEINESFASAVRGDVLRNVIVPG
jgi:S-(hydroxymethyl)glutathione dehydrogenase/alcohol dehydrogenase